MVVYQPFERFLSTLVLDGVLERFPQLRGGAIEVGAGWVPDMIRRLDHAVTIWSRSERRLADFQRLPSEQAGEQLRFTPYPFEDVGLLSAISDPRLYMFSSDYPHAEGGHDRFGASTPRWMGMRPRSLTASITTTPPPGSYPRSAPDLAIGRAAQSPRRPSPRGRTSLTKARQSIPTPTWRGSRAYPRSMALLAPWRPPRSPHHGLVGGFAGRSDRGTARRPLLLSPPPGSLGPCRGTEIHPVVRVGPSLVRRFPLTRGR